MGKNSIKLKIMALITVTLLISIFLTVRISAVSRILAAVGFVLLLVISWVVLQLLFRPLGEIRKILYGLKNGEFCAEETEYRKDEFGMIAADLKQAVQDFGKSVESISQDFEKISEGAIALANNTYEGNKSLEVITRTTNEIAEGSQSIGEMASEAAGRTDKVSTLSQSTNEKIEMLKENARAINEAARNGHAMISETTHAIDEIAETADQNGRLTEKLAEQSQQISKIVEMIEQISDQTNLLALNAAIEAARASEHGRGFSVVADEVRKLAEQSQNAAGQIAEIIQEMVKSIQVVVGLSEDTTRSALSGKESMHQALSGFSDITHQIEVTETSVKDVSALATETASHAVSLLGDIHGVAAVSEEEAASTQTVATSAMQVNQLVNDLTKEARGLSGQVGELQNSILHRFRFQSRRVITAALVLSEQTAAYAGMESFAKQLSEKTGGKFELKIFHSEQLGNASQLLEKVISGAVDIIYIGTHQVAAQVKELKILDLPFLFRDEKTVDRILHGSTGREILNVIDQYGFHGLTFAEEGFRDLTNSRHEVRNIEDFHDLKIRVAKQELHQNIIRCLGAEPVALNFNDTYQALREGKIDGQDMPLVTAHGKHILDVQKFLTQTHHSYASSIMLCSASLWQTLSEDDRKLFEKSAGECAEIISDHTRKKSDQIQAELVKNGMRITKLPESEINRMQEAVQPVYRNFREQKELNVLLEKIMTEAR